ncbi:MAG: class II glutamine amidotransferase [Pirellulales bacterium]
MCELLGISFNRPVSAEISIQAFGQRWTENAHGWGLGWYPDASLALVKEPLPWGKTPYSKFLETYEEIRAATYVAHVRHRTTGGNPVHRDTHPFTREWQGRDYCFAHNGTLREYGSQLALDWYHPVGDTDSEHLFCWLLNRLATVGNSLEELADWLELQRFLRQANELGKLNCLLTDGQRLFAYRDLQQWKGLMYQAGRHSPISGAAPLHDEAVHVEIDPEQATESVVVATSPLNDDAWRPIPPGTLLAVEEGRVIFSAEERRSAH